MRRFSLAARDRVPTTHPIGAYVAAGGLMSYGSGLMSYGRSNSFDSYRIVGTHAGRVLKEPADLPVQQPTKFDLVINRKTAKALGITIPDTLLATANEVIE